MTDLDFLSIAALRRWISLKPRFACLFNQKKHVMEFVIYHCQSREDESVRKRILHRYSLLVEYVEEDPLGVLVQPTRIDRVRYSLGN